MKKLILLATALIAFNQNNFAQVPKDSLFKSKNEIGIDLVPFIKILSDQSHKPDIKALIQYKRQINNSLYFRLSASAIKQNEFNHYSNASFKPYGSPDPNLGTLFYEKNTHTHDLHFKTGLEYRWGKKRAKFFTGADLGYAYSRILSESYMGTRTGFGYINPNSPDNMVTDSRFMFDGNDSIIHSHTTIKNGISFTPFVGMQFHFTKKFFFSMQLGRELQFVFVRNKDTQNNIFVPDNFQEIRLSDGLLSNFSLFYKF